MESFELLYFDPIRNIVRNTLPYEKKFYLDADGCIPSKFLTLCNLYYDYDIEHRGFYTVFVRNAIHECRYTLGDFLARYDDGQRRFIKQTHPTFRRWRPQKRKEEI